MGRGAYLKDKDPLWEEEVIKKEVSTENKTKALNPSDIACKNAEYDEVWLFLIRTRFFMLTPGEEDTSSWVYRSPLSLQYGSRSQLFKYWSKH